MKNRKVLSFVSVIAVICIMANLFACISFAADESVKVTVSLASEGSIVVAAKEYDVSDVDGDSAITINDALIISHKDAYPDNENAYVAETTKWGLSIKVLCGVENGGSYGYYVNNASAWSLTDPLNEGDYLYAFVYEDAKGFSDKCSYFEEYSLDAKATEEITVTLMKNDFDEDWNSVQKPVEGAKITIDGNATDIVTDSEGKATIKFSQKGEYLVSAKSESEIISPAVLKVNVTNYNITVSLACEGKIVVPAVDYEVYDIDGDEAVTINDALIISHKDAYPDNENAYVAETTKWGLSIKVLCGVENGGSYGYYVNNASAWSLTDPLKEGDYLYAFVYEDAEGFSDRYSYFDAYMVFANANEKFTVTLTKSDFDEDWNSVQKPVEGAIITVDGKDTEFRTDANGKAEISFAKGGSFVVSARSESEVISPAVLLVSIPKNGWMKENGSWYYYKDDVAQTGWQKVDGKWYYLDENGVMLKGWQKVNGKWYYLNKSGEMLTGWQKIGKSWYYLNNSGAMLSGWQKINNKWYFFGGADSGVMRTGWQKIKGKWYYLNKSGVMLTGWQKISGKWYYLNKSGVMLTGWQKISGRWFYMNKSGVMLTGWQKIDGKKYFFDYNGVYVSAKDVKAYTKSYDKLLEFAKLGNYNSSSKRYIYAFDTLSAGTGRKICSLEYDAENDELYASYIMDATDYQSRTAVLIDKDPTNRMEISFAYKTFKNGKAQGTYGAVGFSAKDAYTSKTKIICAKSNGDKYTASEYSQLMTSQTAHIFAELNSYLAKNSDVTLASLGYKSYK